MAAVLPYQESDAPEEEGLETPEEKAWFESVDLTELSGLGRIINDPSSGWDSVLDSSHAQLIRLAWSRWYTLKGLVGREIELVDTKDGPRIVLVGPPLDDPPWGSYVETNFADVLGWNSKMATPHFTLPAGPPQFGGACPGSQAGQTIVEAAQAEPIARHVSYITDMPIVPASCVCQYCYAEKGQYGYLNNIMRSCLRYVWANQALADGSFVGVMDYAVKSAEYNTGAFKKGKNSYKAERKDHRYKRYFRIHDAGDFFNPDYLAAWVEVTRLNPDIGFWSPSRLWAIPGTERWLAPHVDDWPENFTLRPSAYLVNAAEPMELGPPWAAWSVVYDNDMKRELGTEIRMPKGAPFNWDCGAYRTGGKPTCRNAEDFDGKTGCRTCWDQADQTVNYTKH